MDVQGPVFAQVLPMLAMRMAWELEAYPVLAAQVPELRIVGRCGCGQSDCQTLGVDVPDGVPLSEDPRRAVFSAGLGCDLATIHIWDGRIHHIQMLGAEWLEPAIAAALAGRDDE
jgi:hypothetical protein